MRAVAEFTNAESVDVSITITLPVKEWREMALVLSGTGWPEWAVKDAIERAVRRVTERIDVPLEIAR